MLTMGVARLRSITSHGARGPPDSSAVLCAVRALSLILEGGEVAPPPGGVTSAARCEGWNDVTTRRVLHAVSCSLRTSARHALIRTRHRVVTTVVNMNLVQYWFSTTCHARVCRRVGDATRIRTGQLPATRYRRGTSFACGTLDQGAAFGSRRSSRWVSQASSSRRVPNTSTTACTPCAPCPALTHIKSTPSPGASS